MLEYIASGLLGLLGICFVILHREHAKRNNLTMPWIWEPKVESSEIDKI